MKNPITNMFVKKVDVRLYGPTRIVKMTKDELQELRDLMQENPYLQEFIYDKETKSQDKKKPTLDLTQLKIKQDLKKEWWSANYAAVNAKREAIITLLTENGMEKAKAIPIAKTYDKKRAGLIPSNLKDKYEEKMKEYPKDIFTLKEYQEWAKNKNVKAPSEPINPIEVFNDGIDNIFKLVWSVEDSMRARIEARNAMIAARNAEIGKVEVVKEKKAEKAKPEPKKEETVIEVL